MKIGLFGLPPKVVEKAKKIMNGRHYFVKILLIFAFFKAHARPMHTILSPVKDQVPGALGARVLSTLFLLLWPSPLALCGS